MDYAHHQDHRPCDNEVRRYACTFCPMRFKKGNQLRQHMTTHLAPVDKPFRCGTCDKHFSRKTHLKSHQITHTKQSIYKCDECSMPCPTKSNLLRHQLLHFRNRHDCPHCKKIFEDKLSLEEHITKTHKNICHECGKEFMYKGNFSYHIHSHDDDLTCRRCGKVFNGMSSYRLHCRVHKLHTCDVCGKKIEGLRAFRKHKASPHLYECIICSISFKEDIDNYNRHMNDHYVDSKKEDGSSIDEINDFEETGALQNHKENSSTRTGNEVNSKDCPKNSVAPVTSTGYQGSGFLEFLADRKDERIPIATDFLTFVPETCHQDNPTGPLGSMQETRVTAADGNSHFEVFDDNLPELNLTSEDWENALFPEVCGESKWW